MAADQNWMNLFYGEGRMDVQLTNTLYEQRYGKTGTTVGYTNTVANPATTGNPATPGTSAYNPNAQIYTNSAGTQTRPASQPGAPSATANQPQPVTPPANTPTTQSPQTPTTGGGAQPTVGNVQDLLQEFLESDPDLILNYTANQFREMGASNIFMQWYVRSLPGLRRRAGAERPGPDADVHRLHPRDGLPEPVLRRPRAGPDGLWSVGQLRRPAERCLTKPRRDGGLDGYEGMGRGGRRDPESAALQDGAGLTTEPCYRPCIAGRGRDAVWRWRTDRRHSGRTQR